MRCPHCSFDNSDDAAFCEKCGHVFLSSDRVPQVPDPAERERRREAALTDVPPIVQVPDITPSDATGVIGRASSIPEVVPSATGPLDRSSVAHLVDPLPEPPREPDFSGFERLVDSSYVPPAATAAGDTAEIPVIHDEYVPRPRNYTLGLSPREQRKRDREQRRLEKKFAKAQRKEDERSAKEAARAEREAERAAALAEQEARAAEALEAARAAEAALDEQSAVCEEPPAACDVADRPALAASEEPRAAARGAAAADDGDATMALPAADLDTVLMTGDGVVSLFERTSKRRRSAGIPAGTPASKAALELPGAETGLAVAGERAIESASGEPADPEAPGGLALADPAEADGGALAASDSSAPVKPAASVSADAAGDPGTSSDVAEAARAAEPKEAPGASRQTADSKAEAEAARAKRAAEKAAQTAEKRAAKAARAAERATSRPKRRKAPLVIAVTVALGAALALLAGGTYMAEIWGGKTVPAVVGMTRDKAVAALEGEGFSVEATEVKSDEAAGTVLSEAPNGGARIAEGSTVALEVAVPRAIPDIKGFTRQEAADALGAEGFTAVEYKEKKSNKAEGTVLKVSPKAGTEALSTEPVTVTVAVPFTVPDVAGMDTDAAKETLSDEGYEVTTLWSYTEDTPEGTALSTEPEAGAQLDSGSEVTLYIAKSRGNELVALAESFLPGARLKSNDGRFIIDSVSSVTYAGDDVVRYTCEAHQYEDVELPFGKGTTRVEDDKRVTIEGSLTFNGDNEVTTADPAIKY